METRVFMCLLAGLLFLGSRCAGDRDGVNAGMEAVAGNAAVSDGASLKPVPATRRADSTSYKLVLLRKIYTAEIGVREATGHNDGPRIAEYLRYCNLTEGHAWCAAYVSWCHGQAGYPQPRNAWSPALFPKARVVWRKGTRDTRAPASPDGEPASADGSPRPGDVFGIHYANLGRIGHCGFVDRWDGTWCETVEGNAEPDQSYNARDGPRQGVHRKRRLVRTIHAVSRWTE